MCWQATALEHLMISIESLTVEAADPAAAKDFYAAAFGLEDTVHVRTAQDETEGFRWFSVSLVVAQPADVDGLVNRAIDAGATTVKAPKKSFWGYGAVVRTPDGSMWKVVTQSKKDSGPASDHIDDIVLLLGAADVRASKQFYVDHGLKVSRSFGGKYAEFEAPPGRIKLALYGRRGLARDTGVPPEGTGSHRIAVHSNAGAFTDPDGFVWEPTSGKSRVHDPEAAGIGES